MARRLIRAATGLALWLALLAGLGLVSAPSAEAATRYTLTATGAGVTTTATARTLTAKFKKNGKAVKKATAVLEYRSGTRWVTEKKVTIKKGKATVKVKHSVMTRTYRFRVKGKATSKSFVVQFVPATFTVKGSGAGHGVGMAQYGAYQLARTGKSAAQILTTYYQGAAVDPAVVNNPRTIKVQVLGPPADTRTTTTLSLTSGGFTITGAGDAVTTKGGTRVTVGVSAGNATAKVTLSNGKAATLTGARLTFRWGSGSTASVAGAHGSYRYGNLQVTALRNRPNVVNELAMNTEYLYGIDEMPADWAKTKGMEALKAQAIAARTYVIVQASRANATWGAGQADPACDCQVFDDARSQNFTGWAKSAGDKDGNWRKAVDATQTATTVTAVRPSAGSHVFAETVYFSSSGIGSGFGTIPNDIAFGTPALSYLTHVVDPYSGQAPGNRFKSWERKFSQSQLQAALGIQTPIRAVAVTSRYQGGQLKTLTVTTAAGKKITLTKTPGQWRATFATVAAWIGSVPGK